MMMRRLLTGGIAFGTLIGALGTASTTTSCAPTPSNDRVTDILLPDFPTYSDNVDSYLQRRCGTLDCHGQAGRAYRLYGFSGYRLISDADGGLVTGQQPTTAAEVLANYQAAVGLEPAAVTETVVIDYSAPNVAKEMHVGHLRSTVIGDSLARVLEWRGHTILRQNHIGDWGTLFGMLIEHMVDLGEAQAVAALGIGQLAQFYKAAREVRQRAGVRASLAPPRRRAASGRPADAAAVARARRSVDALLRDHLRNTRHHAAAR